MSKTLKSLFAFFIVLYLAFASIANADEQYLTRSDLNLTSFLAFNDSVETEVYDRFNIDKNVNTKFQIPSKKILLEFEQQLNAITDSKSLLPNSLISTYQKLLDQNPKYIFHIYQIAKSRAYALEGSFALNLISEIELILVEQVGSLNNIKIATDSLSKRTLVQLGSVYQKISSDLQVDMANGAEKFSQLTGYGINSKQFSWLVAGISAAGIYYAVDELLDEGCTAPNLNLSVNLSQVDEDAGTATITATLDSALETNLTIPFTVSGTATSGFDYSTVSNISITAGSLTGTSTFTASNDIQFESSTNEIAIFSIANITGVCIGANNSVSIAIIDDDTAPTVQLSSSASSIAEDAGTSITLTATLSSPTYEAVRVALTPTGTATEGTDYSTITDITIAAGTSLGTASFTPTNDTMYETATAETAAVAITGVTGGGATESGTQSVSLSITADSDAAPTTTLASSASSVSESGSDLTLTATLSNPTHETVTISIDGTGGSATEGTDFATVSDITIASGDTTGTAAFNPTVDSLYDASSAESAVIAISGVTGGSATESGTQTATISITDGDSAPTVTIASSASTVGEGESDLTLTATLSVATYANVIVAIDGTGGTGTEGSDFATISDITISAGSTTGTTAFSPTDDSGTYENTETAIIAISGVSGGSATESGTQTTTVSITENETAPTVTLATSGSSIAENSSGTLTLTATLSISTYENVIVTLDPSGTGTEGTDYANISNITISAGSTSGTTTFDPTNDNKYESSTAETAVVAITGVSGGNASESGTQTASISITEDDAAPTVTLAASADTLDENSNDNITITATLNRATYETVTISLTPTGTADEGDDYNTVADITIAEDATTGTSTFSSIDDCTIEGNTNETAAVAITGVSGGGATESGTQSVALEIDDDEGAPKVTLAASATSITEGNGSITLTASIGLCEYTSNIIVAFSTSGGATEGTDYTTIPDVTIPAGDTSVTTNFTPSADSLYDAASAETATIAISGVSGGTASESGTQAVTLTIVDSDSAPTVTLASSASSVGEDASDLTLTATLSVKTYAAVTVTIDGTGGTGTEGTDFATVSNITIDAGDTTGTTAFNPTPDDVFDAASAETGVIAISGVSGGSASESGTQSVSISITDAESAPTVTLASSASSVGEDASDLTLTATLSVKTYAAVTVTIDGTGGTGTEGTDFATVSNITIDAGDTTGTTAFNPTPDDVFDAASAETGVIAISGVSGGSASESGTQSVSISITDAESAPTVQLSSNVSAIDEDSTSSITLTATLSGKTYENVIVAIATNSGSGIADEGTDFATVSDITISAGSTTGTTTFNPTNDCVIESGNETSTISMSGFTGGGASAHGSNQSKQLTITDDEGTPSITLATSATSVAESGSDLTLTAAIVGSCTASADITVALDGTGGSATEGTDFATVSDITISAGQSSGTTAFNPTVDSIYDAASAETATIDISGVSGSSAEESGTQQVSISITESNSAPTVTLTTNDTSLSESDSDATLTATLSLATYQDVTVTLDTSGTATEGTDYANISNITVSAGSTTGTTAFNPTDDSHYDAASAESATVYISGVSGGAATESGTQTLAIAITDNENAPTVSLSSSASTVADHESDLTITATLSHTTYAATTVLIDGTAGAATEGTDFAVVSDITISANATTGTSAFNPTASTSYEASETATLAISDVTGGGGASENGTQTVSISITQNSLNIGTAHTDYSSTYATAYANLDRYNFVNYDNGDGGTWHSSNNYLHPYTALNLHKVWSHNNGVVWLSGSGETVAIMDGGYNFGFSSSFTHEAFDYKKSNGNISKYGTLTAAATNAAGTHGAIVSAIAAAEFIVSTDDDDFIGVAWAANIHATQKGAHASDDGLTHTTNGTIDADNNHAAIVQNNSWGIVNNNYCDANVAQFNRCVSNGWNDSQVLTYSDLKGIKDYHSLSWDQAYSFFLASDYSSSTSITKMQNYITALNNFQDTGVIVFALSNTYTENDGSAMSGLPLAYTQLAEAWLSVGWIEIQGSTISASSVKRGSGTGGGKCGLQAAFCVVAPGGNYNGPGWQSANHYVTNLNGSSFAAPAVSGSIALLAQAFPNHTPAQLVDRLLASANNSFFTISAFTEFTNGVKHGYNTEFGHGIPDIYGALSPINSGLYSTPMVYVGNNLNGTTSIVSNIGSGSSLAYSTTETSMNSSLSFGDSLRRSLSDRTSYYYDSLNGGFEFNFSSIFGIENSLKNIKDIVNEDLLRLKNVNLDLNKSYEYTFNNILGSSGDKAIGLLSFSIDVPSTPIQYFNNLNNGSDLYLASFKNPFTDSKKGGLGINYQEQIGDNKILIGYHDTEQRSGLYGETEFETKTLAMTVSQSNETFDNFTLLTGLMIEQDTLLDSKGSGALGFHDTNPHSLFAGVNLEKVIGDDLSIKFVSTIGYSTVDTPSNSLIGEVSDITSASFNFIANKYNIFNDNDRLAISIGQPNRVESGSMMIRIPGLAAATGEIPYENVIVDLTPSGRQIDFGIDYVTKLDNDLILGFKHTLSKDFNHIESSALNNTVTFTAKIDF